MPDFVFDENAIPELIRKIEAADLYDEAHVADILYAGAAVFVETAKTMALRAGHRDTGAAIDHITYRRKLQKKNSVYSVTLTVSGKDREGVSNAVKLFVLNYGRAKEHGHITGSHFWNEAMTIATPKMLRVAAEKATQLLQEKGLI